MVQSITAGKSFYFKTLPKTVAKFFFEEDAFLLFRRLRFHSNNNTANIEK